MTNGLAEQNLPQVVNLDQVLEILEQRAAAAQAAPDRAPAVGTRAARKREAALPRSFAEEQHSAMRDLAVLAGSTVLPETPRDLEQYEIDNLMFEILRVRDGQDLLVGRHEAIKLAVYDAIDARHSDDDRPDQASGALVSRETGHKFVRDMRGGKPNTNWLALQDLVDVDVWKRISFKVETTVNRYDSNDLLVSAATTVGYDLNFDEILRAIQDGTISIELVESITTRPDKNPYFLIQDIGPEDG